MIYSINGILEMVEPYHIVVECGGTLFYAAGFW